METWGKPSWDFRLKNEGRAEAEHLIGMHNWRLLFHRYERGEHECGK